MKINTCTEAERVLIEAVVEYVADRPDAAFSGPLVTPIRSVLAERKPKTPEEDLVTAMRRIAELHDDLEMLQALAKYDAARAKVAKPKGKCPCRNGCKSAECDNL